MLQMSHPYLFLCQVIDRSLCPIRVHRYLSGYGRERGGIIITFQNFDEVPLKVAYLESVPWFLKIYLHTLNASTLPIEDGTKVDFGKFVSLDKVSIYLSIFHL